MGLPLYMCTWPETPSHSILGYKLGGYFQLQRKKVNTLLGMEVSLDKQGLPGGVTMRLG